MADTISNMPDAAFLDLIEQVKTVIAAHPADYPMITAPIPADLDDARDAFGDSLPAHIAAQADSKAKRITKDDDRDVGEALIRKIRALCKAGQATEAAITALGIPVGSAEAPTTATVPAVKIDTSERMRHRIDYFDAATPENRRRPRGVTGVQVWNKIDGPPPADEKECIFVTLDTRSPVEVEHDSEHGGKLAHYMLRWQYRDGSVGAWSETASATITA